jgi:hypothetical protein
MREGDLQLHALLDRRAEAPDDALSEPSSRCFCDVRMVIICWEVRDLLYYLLPSPTRRSAARSVHSYQPSGAGRP